MAKSSKSKKKMSQEKKNIQNDRQRRKKNVYRVGALILVAVMIIALVATYAL